MTTTQKTLSIVAANAAMKTAVKKTAAKKPAAKKPAAKKAAAPVKWDNALIPRIAENVTVYGKAIEAKAAIEADIAKFRTYKVKIGDLRTCGIAKEFHAAFIALGVKEKTATNYLSCLRNSVNKGMPFSLNQSRANAKGKGGAAPNGKGGAAPNGKGGAAPSSNPSKKWKEPSEVLDALAIVINAVKKKAGAALWEKAMTAAPDGFDFAIADFLESQGETTE